MIILGIHYEIELHHATAACLICLIIIQWVHFLPQSRYSDNYEANIKGIQTP
jgi:hypothetical protein